MSFTVGDLNDWYGDLESNGYGNNPDDRLPADKQTPFGEYDVVDEGRDRDEPSNWNYVIKIGDRYFQQIGYYSSWDGVEFDEDQWHEVVQRERTETYWASV